MYGLTTSANIMGMIPNKKSANGNFIKYIKSEIKMYRKKKNRRIKNNPVKFPLSFCCEVPNLISMGPVWLLA